MKLGALTATRLRIILAVSLLLIEVLGSLFVTNADRILKSYAAEVSQVRADANASQNNVQTLRKIQQELLANKDAIARTNGIVADSQSYQYQDQIITDLNDYAKRANITLTNLDFLATAPSGTTTPAPTGGTTAVAGVKTTSVSVTIKNPVEYDRLLRFIKSIEENLTKMQISSIGLAKDSGGGVTSQVLTIEVYIR
ncbi:MAG: exported protein of unknown function [Candidatus Saccharibacteria bacterium]|nr:exported protein of unknown function [Candidatus Saccharibacteria bacterium]